MFLLAIGVSGKQKPVQPRVPLAHAASPKSRQRGRARCARLRILHGIRLPRDWCEALRNCRATSRCTLDCTAGSLLHAATSAAKNHARHGTVKLRKHAVAAAGRSTAHNHQNGVQWDAAWRRIVPRSKRPGAKRPSCATSRPRPLEPWCNDGDARRPRKSGGFLSARGGAHHRADRRMGDRTFSDASRHNKSAGRPRHVDPKRRRGINAGVRALRSGGSGRVRSPMFTKLLRHWPRYKVAAPPHADAQGVLVLQTCGSQRWRVWDGRPFYASELNTKLTAGKGAPLTLGAPFLDVRTARRATRCTRRPAGLMPRPHWRTLPCT